MKLLALFTGSVALAFTAIGQTNAAGPGSPAGETNVPTRTISLTDSIQQALEHSLAIQIERFNPMIAQYNVKSSQAGYDPVLSLSAEHDYTESGGVGFDPNTGLPIPGSITKADVLSGSLLGELPFGTTYSFFGNATERYGTSGGGAGFDNTRGSVGVSVTQPLLRNFWMNATRLNIQVSKNRLKYSESVFRSRVMDVITQVEFAYYDLIAAIENVKVREKAQELAERLLAENKKRVEVGALAPLDEKQAASQVATALADLLSARQALDFQENVLKSLLTDNYQQLHEVYLSPIESLAAPVQTFNLQESWKKGMELRPDLQQAKLDLERQGIQLKYDRNQLFPQLDVFGSYGYGAGGATTIEFSDAFRDFRRRDLPFYSYGAQFSIPLSNRRARNDYKSSKLAVQQVLLIVKQLEQQILVEIDNAIVTAQASYQRVDATRAAREYAEAALEAEQKKLESGKSTSFIVLQLQRDLTAARSAEIAALADYNKALAALAQSEGTTLDRRAVNIQIK